MNIVSHGSHLMTFEEDALLDFCFETAQSKTFRNVQARRTTAQAMTAIERAHQRRQTQSAPPLATQWPMGHAATHHAGALCPSHSTAFAPRSVTHSLTEPSAPALYSAFLSHEKSSPYTGPAWPYRCFALVSASKERSSVAGGGAPAPPTPPPTPAAVAAASAAENPPPLPRAAAVATGGVAARGREVRSWMVMAAWA